MEPLKVGDMVVCVGGRDEDMIGWTGIVEKLGWSGEVMFKGEIATVINRVVWMAHNGTRCASAMFHLLKITPPPTMIETEQEITA